MDEADKLAQELSDCKKQLKAAVFDNKLASFDAFASSADASLFGQLAFTHIELPFKKLDFASTTDLKPVDIRSDYDFLLPLEHGQRIVAFKRILDSDDVQCFTKVSCFNRLGRLIHFNIMGRHVQQENVAQSGPSEFGLFTFSETAELSVYDSHLNCLRFVRCFKNFSTICCYDKFVFGLWDMSDAYNHQYRRNYEQDSRQWIQVHHLHTLNEVFCMRVPNEYTIERMMAEEHRVVAISRRDRRPLWQNSESGPWCMNLFDVDIFSEWDYDFFARRCMTAPFPVSEWHIGLDMQLPRLENVFLLDGWLVVTGDNEIFWFDREGKRSETITKLDNGELRTIYSSSSSLLFSLHDDTLLLKRQ